MHIRLWLTCLLIATVGFAAEAEFPEIQGHGGVFDIAGDPEGPKKGSRVVVDVTTSDYVGGVNKGFDRAARFVNLLALGGDDDFKMAIILHGGATKEALSDDQYREKFGKANPNRSLMAQLRKAGAEILVCGQSMTHSGFDVMRTAPEVDVALSAATASMNRQGAGYALLSIQ